MGYVTNFRPARHSADDRSRRHFTVKAGGSRDWRNGSVEQGHEGCLQVGTLKARIPNWTYEHAGNFCQELFTEIGRAKFAPPLQIKVTTEQIVEHGESSTNEWEYELQKVCSIPQSGPDEVLEEKRSPDHEK